MKTFSGPARFAGAEAPRAGVFCLALVLGAVIFATGCSKKSVPPPSSPPPPPPPDISQPRPPSAAPSPVVNPQPAPAAPATNAATGSADLQVLNQKLFGWRIQTHQRPKSFEDFVTRANIQVPPPPAGKKYVINKRGFIVLVDSSVN